MLSKYYTFCARPKDDLYLVNSILVPAQNFLEWHKMQFNFWSCTKYLDRPKTFWDLEKDKAEEHSDLGEHRVVFQKIKTFWHPSKINATQNSYKIHKKFTWPNQYKSQILFIKKVPNTGLY